MKENSRAKGGISNVEHRTSNIERRTSNVEHRTSNVEHRTLNVEHRTLNVEHRTNIEHALQAWSRPRHAWQQLCSSLVPADLTSKAERGSASHAEAARGGCQVFARCSMFDVQCSMFGAGRGGAVRTLVTLLVQYIGNTWFRFGLQFLWFEVAVNGSPRAPLQRLAMCFPVRSSSQSKCLSLCINELWWMQAVA
jgi:hypothetical protein